MPDPENRVNIDGGAPEPEERPGGIGELQEELARQTGLVNDHYNRLLRLQADFDNYRKRVQKEREEERRYAAEQFILGILPALDNLERALAARGEQEGSILRGVEMIQRQIMEFLAREGVAPVPAVGAQFDPAIHEAVAHEPDAGKEDNEVVEELRRGYYLKGKVIRPAMVKVCRNC
ncbi:MAG: nucleotide exchange factor GrpE [Peptococcaceae bacterium]|jgi:molecular chaperone GrpE|nr:nucleotide exchange factor GrpE [Peptococcaceae bacterium]